MERLRLNDEVPRRARLNLWSKRLEHCSQMFYEILTPRGRACIHGYTEEEADAIVDGCNNPERANETAKTLLRIFT